MRTHFGRATREELSTPLRRKGLGERLWEKRPSALIVAYALSTAVFTGGVWYGLNTPLPYAGEPVVVASIPTPEEIITATAEPAPFGKEADAAEEEVAEAPVNAEANATEEYDVAVADAVAQSEAKKVPETAGIEKIGSDKIAMMTVDKGQRQDTYRPSTGNIIISARRPLIPAPVRAVAQEVSDGFLPIIGPSGAKPFAVYARNLPLSIVHSDAPKIAIVLGGLGLSKKLTERAIKELPTDVTLAFAPYGNDLQAQVNAARREGHEVFLQVPLEPNGYPATNPGPRTLLSESTPKDNTESLHWHMSRFAGYAGVVNYMGGRYLANAETAEPLLKEIKQRGLVFLEDGSVPNSQTDQAAGVTKARVARAQTVIDANPTTEAIRSALDALEKEAVKNGFAIGTGSGLAITIDTLKDWSREAAERGIIFVPVSAAYRSKQG
jgi:uncharacterized protein